MGVRQVLGLVFSEIWFAVKDAIKAGKSTGESLFYSIGDGVKQGFLNAKAKYKELMERFVDGAISGVLSSLTTTLCNIFFTTAKSLVRILRQSWSSLVSATKILIFNPDCLPPGERIRAASKILATGASVVAGTMVSELVAKTAVGTIPTLGTIVQIFCGTLVTGIMSCSLLYMLDNNFISFITYKLEKTYSYSFSVSAPVYQFGLDLIFFVQNYIISLFCANECCIP